LKFTELDLHPSLQRNLDKVQFVDCTPIQESAIPNVLQGRDIAGLAQTGTGKTAAFLVPLIDRVLRGQDVTAANATKGTVVEPVEAAPVEAAPVEPGVTIGSEVEDGSTADATAEELHLRHFVDWQRRNYVLILVPTRELAEQVYENAKILLENTGLKAVAVYGGTSYDKQKAGFKDGVEFVIATPGRLIDLFKEHIADLKMVRAVVFDEADRMFDMGFKDDMKFILRRIPRERQFLVFSATLNFDVLNVAYEFGAYPVEINISKDQPKADNVTDEILHIGHTEKPKFLLSLVKKNNPRQAIIFSNFKRNVERIARFLTENGIPAVGISSLLTQAQRNRVMAQFKAENDRNILVATDLAARGLDILGVDMVFNFELPDDPENYVHRIGRTGRAGHKGRAISLVGERDVDALSRIEDYLGHKVEVSWLDDADIVKEMRDFPPDLERMRSRGPGGGGDRGHYRGGGDRRPPRREGGGRGPRREGGGHGQGEQRRSAGGEGGRGPRREEHRGGGQSQQSRQGQQQGEGQQPRQHGQQGPRREGQHPQGQGQGRNRRPRHGRGRDQQRDQNRKPHEHRGTNGAHKHGGGHHHRPRPLAASAKRSGDAGLGKKVTGFFKKLFGAKSE
jgi:ATP-dependent RNA helicase RhlB